MRKKQMPEEMSGASPGNPSDSDPDEEYERLGSIMLPPGAYRIVEITNPHNSDYGPCLALSDPTKYFDGLLVHPGDLIFLNKWTIVSAPKSIVRLDCRTSTLQVSYAHQP